jgi:hypothetical protein
MIALTQHRHSVEFEEFQKNLIGYLLVRFFWNDGFERNAPLFYLKAHFSVHIGIS